MLDVARDEHLLTEATADVVYDDPDPILRDSGESGCVRADLMRALTRDRGLPGMPLGQGSTSHQRWPWPQWW
jgi:hypothetical protein